MKKLALVALLPFALAACNEAAEEPVVDETVAPVEAAPAETMPVDTTATDPMADDAMEQPMDGTPEPAETPEPKMTNAPG